MANKERLDVYMVNRGMSESRQKAQQIIMSGIVYVNGLKVDKSGFSVSEEDKVEIRGETCPYVSRGGYKLEKAVKSFGLVLDNLVCMDIGASTGGFTDCMLLNGASKVYSVDVGYGQLAWKLRTDPRVVNLERTNIRKLDPEVIKDRIDFISIDVSFISLKLVLSSIKMYITDNTEIVALIKPQFEAGKDKVGKNGVIRDLRVHKDVVHEVINFCENEGFTVSGLTFSPIKGPKGNIEYLIYLSKKSAVQAFDIDGIVEQSHAELDGGV